MVRANSQAWRSRRTSASGKPAAIESSASSGRSARAACTPVSMVALYRPAGARGRDQTQIGDNWFMFGFFKTWRRKRALRRFVPDDALWRQVTGGLPFLHGLTDADWQRLRDYAVLFLDEKEMHGARGFILTDAVRLSIAVQACLPILNLGLDA